MVMMMHTGGREREKRIVSVDSGVKGVVVGALLLRLENVFLKK